MRLQEEGSHCKFVGRGVTWGKECFTKNDLPAVYRLDQKGQRKQEGQGGHDNNIGLTWEQQGNRKEEREGDIKKRETLHWLNSPEQTLLNT